MCTFDFIPSLNFPVHSRTTSQPDQSRSFGSYDENTLTGPLPILRWSFSTVISPENLPCTLSFFNRCTFVSIGPVAFILVTWMSFLALSAICENVLLPIGPKPLIPTLIDIS